jgi:hypothetical protein
MKTFAANAVHRPMGDATTFNSTLPAAPTGRIWPLEREAARPRYRALLSL